MKSSAAKVKIDSFDSLFGGGEPQGEQVRKIPLNELNTFRGHPFRVLEDEKMQETVESVKKYGILVPGIVRPYPEGGYEVVAGHRRWKACELAGLKEMPMIVRELNDDEATIIMVDANIQREDVLPSEKAKAYKMKYEAMRHQGSRGEKYTADAVGEAAGDSGRTVQRYIRLAELTQELLDFVDESRIPMVVGERLSYLKTEEQDWLVEAIRNSGMFPSKGQAEQLKECSEAGELTEGQVYAVMVKRESTNVNVTIPAKKIRSYFPAAYSREQMEEVIYMLLGQWKENKEREEGADAGDSV